MNETWSGLDVSKQWFDASCVSHDTQLCDFASIPHARFSRNPAGVRRFLAWLDQRTTDPVRAIMEVTGNYSIQLWAWLVEARPSLEPAIVNPRQAKHHHKSLGLRNKTDKVDARSLGLMGKERRPRPYEELPGEYQQLRELIRQRRSFVDQKVAEQQRLQEASHSCRPVRRHLKSHIRHLQKLIQRTEKVIDKLLAANEALTADLQLLMTIPGVGRITALTILGELGDLRRYNRSRQVSALSGLSPRKNESGSSQDSSHMDRHANPALRTILYLAAMTATNPRTHDNRLARQYRRHLNNGKKKKQALVAVGRKIMVIMRALLIHGQPYQDDHQPI